MGVKDYPPYLDLPKKRKRMTNADRIRAMSDKELAEVIMCPYDSGPSVCGRNDCIKCCADWLRQPAEGEQHG